MTQPLRLNGILVSTILRGCENKRRYPDEYVARGVGQSFEAQNGTPLYIYPCKICRGWHLTKQPQRDDKRRVTYNYPKTER